ncbi:zinc finger, CCHC-type containing protein [Tanacetum coccineum]|uniref:Zinc finger, CCHC-type containing protein n=1 Tax=Tanacetum coccineum TaxID=301880 RepID=A0ABQ5F074_9ASTR
MHFLLSCMSVVYVLTTHIPKDGENATVDQIRRRNKWDNDDYVYRGLILKGWNPTNLMKNEVSDVAFWKDSNYDGDEIHQGNNMGVGFRQKSGIDYFDTYAPVVRISTIRLLIAMTSIRNLIIHQMDVKTAFLNGVIRSGGSI